MIKYMLPFALVLAATSVQAQEEKTYPDGHGGEVFLPLGDMSFADEVISFEVGDPSSDESRSIPEKALGVADFPGSGIDHYLTLGCGGVLVTRFVDNTLVNIDGPDFYVFEIGPAVEATEVAISNDGENWIDIGRIAGATAALDLGDLVEPGESFSYVRLTDTRAACQGGTPGADIDAIAAIGAGQRVTLDSAVLFDVDSAQLKVEAEDELMSLADQIKAVGNARVMLEGHTDNTGTDAYNQTLSQQRAAAVGAFLVTRGGIPADSISTAGYGEARPVAPNDTEEERAMNRRVEALITAGG